MSKFHFCQNSVLALFKTRSVPARAKNLHFNVHFVWHVLRVLLTFFFQIKVYFPLQPKLRKNVGFNSRSVPGSYTYCVKWGQTSCISLNFVYKFNKWNYNNSWKNYMPKEIRYFFSNKKRIEKMLELFDFSE